MKMTFFLFITLLFLTSCKKEPLTLTADGTLNGTVIVTPVTLKVHNQVALSGGDIPEDPILR